MEQEDNLAYFNENNDNYLNKMSNYYSKLKEKNLALKFWYEGKLLRF